MKFLQLARDLSCMALACQALAVGRADVFDAKADYTGTPANLTVSASITPAATDTGSNGSYYVAAFVGSQAVFLTPSGWVPFDGTTFPAAATGALAPISFPLLNGTVDISSFECAGFVAGYGTSATDMLGNGLFRVIYQVPAKLPHVSPLPCSAMADSDVARFLQQASFGPTDASIADVKRLGMSGWIESQFTIPKTGYGVWPYADTSAPASCSNDGNSASAASMCARDTYSLFQLQRLFFQNAISGPDQLRQRVAWALSETLVISGEVLNMAYSYAGYQHMLLDNAFGNYETILTRMTLSPAMGDYLDMVNNGKPSTGQQANENYARELMQLFSIGLYKLNLDGTVQTDANGSPIPSYNEDVIKGFARTFTGWTYPPKPGVTSRTYNPTNYVSDMVAVASNHDTGTKQLLDSTVLPANQTPDKDLADAIHTVFMHPNVGPFIGKQLIQRLVTSNPSPAYVARVASAFNDNGSGVRGDMKAVIRAILLDSEARGGMRTETNYGHLREPALFLAQFYRSLGGVSDGVALRSVSSNMSQNVFYSPTVFNYYPADNVLATGQAAPEFGIHNTSTALARANTIYSAVYGSATGNIIYLSKPDATVTGATGTYLDMTPYIALASNPAALVDKLNMLLMHGTMPPETRTAIINAVTAAGTAGLARAQLAIYLTANSPQFMVER